MAARRARHGKYLIINDIFYVIVTDTDLRDGFDGAERSHYRIIDMLMPPDGRENRSITRVD